MAPVHMRMNVFNRVPVKYILRFRSLLNVLRRVRPGNPIKNHHNLVVVALEKSRTCSIASFIWAFHHLFKDIGIEMVYFAQWLFD